MTTKHSLLFSVFCFLMLFVGCKSANTIIANGRLNNTISTKKLVKQIQTVKPNFKTLAARVKINIEEANKSKSYTLNLRLEQDKQILLTSTPISVVKAIITPTRVAFYNKLDGTYFDGDFSYLSTLLGTTLDFNKVQNILLGDAILELNDKSYKSNVLNKSYVLQPKKQLDIYEVFFLFNPTHFKLDSQQISQTLEARILEVDYLKYQKVNNQTIPEFIEILAVEKEKQLKVNLEYKAVKLNENLRFPFKIPSGYKEINLD